MIRRHHWTLLLALALMACGGGGGGGGGPSFNAAPSANPNPAVTLAGNPAANQILVSVETYAAVTASSTMNIPYVTVTVCNPNVKTQCVTVDHVIVDTGSYGLRILSSFPGVSSLGLPPVTVGANPVGECAQFLGGYMWGSVDQAVVKLASETTTPLPIQLVSDPAVGTSPPSSCGGSINIGSLNGMSGNGLLGVGPIVYDASPYYSCTGSGSSATCSAISSAPTSIEVSNPVNAFTSTDNNGIILQMPAVGLHGAISATGMLTFGIDTQPNNTLSTLGLAKVTPTSSADGSFTATLTGQATYPASYFDSGSNFYYLTLNGVPTDNNPYSTNYGNYIPSSPIAFTGTAGGVPVSFSLFDITTDYNNGNQAFNDNGNNGGGLAGTSADFGMPYYYGHTIASVMAGKTVTEGTGAFYAIQ